MRILVDSSVLVSFFNDLDYHHSDAVNFVNTILKQEKLVIIMPVIVFLEVTHVLYRHLGSFDESTIFYLFEKYEKIDLNFTLASGILPFLKKINLKTSDAIISAIAKMTGTTLITWDKKLQKEAQKLVEVLTPKEFLRKF